MNNTRPKITPGEWNMELTELAQKFYVGTVFAKLTDGAKQIIATVAATNGHDQMISNSNLIKNAPKAYDALCIACKELDRLSRCGDVGHMACRKCSIGRVLMMMRGEI